MLERQVLEVVEDCVSVSAIVNLPRSDQRGTKLSWRRRAIFYIRAQ